MKKDYNNVILIGMSGAGKSTLGVLLAKAMGKNFFDTDILIQQREGKLLQQIIDKDGLDKFMKAEEKAILSLKLHGCVIATGGSVVYSDKAMKHLKRRGVVIYLAVDFEELESRISNIKSRGIVFKGGGDLRAVYEERLPLYEKYADITVNCSSAGIEASLDAIVERLKPEK